MINKCLFWLKFLEIGLLYPNFIIIKDLNLIFKDEKICIEMLFVYKVSHHFWPGVPHKSQLLFLLLLLNFLNSFHFFSRKIY